MQYFREKYGTERYPLDRLLLLMEKQHNRGQDGAGIGCVRLDAEPGEYREKDQIEDYIYMARSEGPDAIRDIFAGVPFVAEAYMGHLRYSTTGRAGLEFVHPYLHRGASRAATLLLCGNFNLTNSDELQLAIAPGELPVATSDTRLLLSQLSQAVEAEMTRNNAGVCDIAGILGRTSPTWDGGYVVCGLDGTGAMWALRDPSGIRPAFWYADDEVMVLGSERPAIVSAFSLNPSDVRELPPGHALLADSAGNIEIKEIIKPGKEAQCSFERIYFSRGNDEDIYRERKSLGALLMPQVVEAIGDDFDNTVFSFIPNTAEGAFYGLMQALEAHLADEKAAEVRRLIADNGRIDAAELDKLMHRHIRREKVVVKDTKLRTFIAESEWRDDLAAHVYDITYGTLRPGEDTLVVVDDSIVRGTTLRTSIISMLNRLHPKRIIVASSSPQVRYPDWYGIDMSNLADLVAFRAAVSLLEESGRRGLLEEVYGKCLEAEKPGEGEMDNYVKEIYRPFTDGEIARRMSEMLTPETNRADVHLIFQTTANLRRALPHHGGDWYFTGNYPTPGGNRMVNRSYIRFYESYEEK